LGVDAARRMKKHKMTTMKEKESQNAKDGWDTSWCMGKILA